MPDETAPEADAKLVRNERAKLTAAYLNAAAGTALGAGVIAPLVAALYGVPGGTAGPLTLALGLTMFFAVSVLLHVWARYMLRGLKT